MNYNIDECTYEFDSLKTSDDIYTVDGNDIGYIDLQDNTLNIYAPVDSYTFNNMKEGDVFNTQTIKLITNRAYINEL
jgi:hypothetical protein